MTVAPPTCTCELFGGSLSPVHPCPIHGNARTKEELESLRERVKESGTADYDSRVDTYEHIENVRGYMLQVVERLLTRAHVHDRSKLSSPEKEGFDEYTPKLREVTYGTPAYAACLEGLGQALHHHYAVNSHHPEHWTNGIQDMSLLDLVEMLCDWMAAVLRHEDGDISKSLEINQGRFGYSDELKQILRNTLSEIRA